VHADFPHTACPDPLTPRHALVSQLGRGARTRLSQEVSFRNRVSPSGPPSLFRPTSPAGALCSTGVTPLPRYYGPLRLPTRPAGGYGFPSVVDPDTGSPGRVSQVPDRSVDARCPVPPRRIRPLQTLIAWRPIAGFTFSGRLAIPICVTRPRGFACATADVFAFPGSDGRVASVAAGSASW
jgi:hypothetical protein